MALDDRDTHEPLARRAARAGEDAPEEAPTTPPARRASVARPLRVSLRAEARARWAMRGALQTVWPVARWVLLVAGLVAVVGGLLALAIWVMPDALVGAPRKGLAEADRLKALNDARSPLVTVVGGLLLFTGALIGAVLTSRTIQVNRESNEITRKGQDATLEITRQGQITDRFTRAIDQLGQHGQDKLDVRLGGIYALERIARESAEDHGPIIEVLTAYLREHARWEAAAASPGLEADAPRRLRADVQAIAMVLGRRPEERRRQEQRRLNLREVDLRRADLSDAHLERAGLRDAHLEKANLIGVRIERATLMGAHLENAALMYAHLEGANLRDAHLEGANLSDAHLEGTDLRGAHLEGADLRTARGLLRDQLQAAITDDTTMWPTFEDEETGPVAEEPP